MTKIKVAIADDHAIVRHGIIRLINSFKNFEVVTDASNGKELVENISALAITPDIALVDVSMPIMDGFETVRQLNRSYQNLKCIALSMSIDFNTVFKMIDAGAKGYLPKDTNPEFMEKTMMDVHISGASYDTFVMDKLDEFKKNEEQKQEFITDVSEHFKLSPREIEFIVRCCSELAYKQIADDMEVSPRTLDGYRESVFKKLGISSRNGILLFAIKEGIYQPKM